MELRRGRLGKKVFVPAKVSALLVVLSSSFSISRGGSSTTTLPFPFRCWGLGKLSVQKRDPPRHGQSLR